MSAMTPHRRHLWMPGALPAAVAAGIAAAIAQALLTGRGGGPLGTEPGPPSDLAHLAAGAVAGGFVVLAHGLWRGSRPAARLAAGALTALGAVRLASGDHVVAAAVALAGAAVLLGARRRFRVGAGPDGIRVPMAIGATSLAGAWTLAVATSPSADRERGVVAAGAASAQWLWDGSWWLASGAPAAVALDALVAAAVAAAVAMLWRYVRPASTSDGHTAADHVRAARIVAAHGDDSLAPFALREDKCFHFSHGGLLAYRTLCGTAVVSGDAIGPPGSAPAILAAFEADAAARGWEIVVTGAAATHLDAYRRLGFRAVCVGEEAVVDPAAFSLAGRAMKSVRHAVTRQQRLGWTVDILPGEQLGSAVVDELAAVERDWRAAQPRLTGFAMSLGRLWGAAEDGRSLYVLGRDPGGTLRAFLRFAEYRGGLSLDVMRRAGESPNGLNDALVVAAIEHARARGLAAVSLNFAGFAHIMATGRRLAPAHRALRWLLTRAHGRFQLEQLVRFNQKFAPRWVPRYLVLRDPDRLPALGLRVLQAEAYVPGPRPRRLSASWRPAARPVAPGSSPTLPAP
jgi:lysyl-tRNA synthetase, class II